MNLENEYDAVQKGCRPVPACRSSTTQYASLSKL